MNLNVDRPQEPLAQTLSGPSAKDSVTAVENNIHLLATDVIDQIAAGEVVERPAHLVKELVENALDAGATAIEIEYDQGGRRVRVTDNGVGIKSEQIALALSRHATSKIASASDLWQLHSFGFRGEALSSIASVSRFTLTSRRAEAEQASRVISEFGKISTVEPCAGNLGTTVLIEELFANVPARLKFMKSEVGESTQIKMTLRALALANEKVEFRLRSKGRVEAIWPAAASFLERAQQVLQTEKLYESRLSFGGFESHAVFASPHDVAGNGRSILLFVQRRWVQDRGLQAAVIDAFRGLLMHGEFPIAMIRLEVPGDEVDVNIHPTKSQVKFRDSQNAFRAVSRSIREGLEKAPWLKVTPASPVDDTNQGAKFSAGTAAEEPRRLSVADLTRPYEAPTPVDNSLTASSDAAPSFRDTPVFSNARFEAPEFSAVVFKTKEDLPVRESEACVAVPQVAQNLGYWSRYQVIGQTHLTYIVVQDEHKMVLVDQHAAHERVAYERLMRAFKSGEIDRQNLLIPLSLELEADGPEALMVAAPELERMGVVLDQNGPLSVVVRAKPAMITDQAIAKVLKELAREIVERGGSFVLEKKISDLAATMACHSVVRAGQAMSHEQMRKLLEQMDEFPLSSFCPHGRPVSLEFPFSKIERDFGRTV